MQPPIGISNFRALIETKDSAGRPYLFVDKSLFIKEILDDLTSVKLIIRPRRFGKTLNMSMLHHFLAAEVNGQTTNTLFNNLKIAEHDKYLEQHQGKYPVVFITFKDIVKEEHFEAAFHNIAKVISQVYSNFQYLLSSSKIAEHQKRIFESILEQRANAADINASLSDLTYYLFLHHGVKPWILIDEYDTPIQTAYTSGYYSEMIQLMRGFLGAALKDNSYLARAVLTGILRVAKESIFSGLNNVKVYSLLNPRFSEQFGFTENEVITLLKQSNLDQTLESVREWYNGYIMGNHLIYNPWSIVNFINEQGRLNAYWVNVSDNMLIRDLILESTSDFKVQFEALLQNQPADTFIDESISFSNIKNNDSAVWSLLLMAGYLKAQVIESMSQGFLCRIEIPNKEVRDLYKIFIARWLSGTENPLILQNFIVNLLNGKMDDFTEQLTRIFLQTFSVHDIKGKEPEKFFHGFMLGLVAGIDPKQYQIHSNKESGYGRFDIAIIPNDPKRLGIIFEVKSVEEGEKIEKLQEHAKKALQQINGQQYSSILLQNKIKNFLKIGVAFCGKELAVEFSARS